MVGTDQQKRIFMPPCCRLEEEPVCDGQEGIQLGVDLWRVRSVGMADLIDPIEVEKEISRTLNLIKK